MKSVCIEEQNFSVNGMGPSPTQPRKMDQNNN